MAEFQEVIRQKKRMCNSVLCCKCDIYRLCGEDLSKCQQFINNNPKKAEEVIMSWAAENPELQYPTWIDWLVDQGLIFITSDTYAFNFLKATDPIPADITQKLGLQPKEG